MPLQKKYVYLFSYIFISFPNMMLFSLVLSLYSLAKPWTVLAPVGVIHPYPSYVNPNEWFIVQENPFTISPSFDHDAFLTQCEQTYEYLKKNPNAPLGILKELHQTHETRIQLLERILAAQKNPAQLRDPHWWNTNFRRIRLHDKTKEDPFSIRLTKYVVYQVQGSPYKTETYNQALWMIKKGTSQEKILQYSRTNILEGILEQQEHTVPLVWLTQNDALEAQMQGTIEVSFPNQSKKLFNVHIHNNMPYKKGVPSTKQDRYWYFREVDFVYGWGNDEKVPIQKDVSFAGDVDNLGFGTMIWVQGEKRDQLGLLVDTGGAFQPNFGQFDWFIGMVQDKEHFYELATEYPSYGTVDILLPR